MTILKRVFMWVAALTLLGPMSANAQQEPSQIGEGAVVYAKTCARCHNARSGTERTDLEWVAIVMHMRARANLTKTQADLVLVFLQATNLPEAGVAGGEAADDTPSQYPAGLLTITSAGRLNAELLRLKKSEGWRTTERRPGG